MTNILHRSRRLRQNVLLRGLIRETSLRRSNLVMPYFVRSGKGVKKPVNSMPGQFQFSIDMLVKDIRELKSRGVNAVILFGIPDRKDARASGAYSQNGIVQRAIMAIKDVLPDVITIADTCLCEYTDHGHCGVVVRKGGSFEIDNDRTLALLGRTALSQAKAGADIIAPSGMMDGMVSVIRSSLDMAGFTNTPIMSYSAKYASAFYGPFRDAAESPPRFGDRSSYQMDMANSDEAMREIELDIKEGADIIMVKPALVYLDIIRRARERFCYPMAAYSVSGEYAMLKAAAQKGWLDEKKAVIEILTSIKRAGADIILTYWAKEASEWIK